MVRLLWTRVSDLFRAPAGIRVPHVGGRFNRRQELERAITHTNDPDDCARNDAQDVVLEDDATDEDVDYPPLDPVRPSCIEY
jgi:hypothetical protein